MKQIILAVVLSLVSVGAFATPPNVAPPVQHTLVGGVIVTAVSGAKTATASIDYNVQMPSLAVCETAKTKVEQSFFSPLAAVTQGLPSEGDARKLVFLQCVARAVVAE